MWIYIRENDGEVNIYKFKNLRKTYSEYYINMAAEDDEAECERNISDVAEVRFLNNQELKALLI